MPIRKVQFPSNAIWPEDESRFLSNVDGPTHWWATWHHCHPWWHLHCQLNPQRMQSEFIKINEDSRMQQPCFKQQEVHHPVAPNYLLWLHFSLSMGCDVTWPRYKPCKASPHLAIQKNYDHFRLNYLQPFTPDFSDKTAFLWSQITNWGWNPSADSAFQQLKAWICNWLLHTTLTCYDWEKPVSILTVTIEYSLGAALLKMATQ